jgi:hypothetical protein
MYRTIHETLVALRRFNAKSPQATRVHYHESVASALVRSARLVAGIKQMYKIGTLESVAVLARALYELSITVYLDWLSPETVGPYFQLVANHSLGVRQAALDSVAKQWKSAGWTDADIEAWRKGQKRAFQLVGKPYDRAMVSPFARIHGKVYPLLCHEAHQDFISSSRFLGALNEGSEPLAVASKPIGGNNQFLLQIVDVAVGIICKCVIAGIPRTEVAEVA